MSTNAFMPQGKTFLVAANATAPSGVQITCFNAAMIAPCVRLFNQDANNTVWYGLGNSAANATAAAQIPTVSGNAGIGLPPLGVEVIRTRFPIPQLWVSGITSVSVQANLEVTPGDGV